MSKNGAFIVIEGLDGSGKTTQARILFRNLCKSHKTFLTAEPSNGKIGKFIRKRILYDKNRMQPTVEALLFAADRLDHVQNEIIPALNRNEIVISDRYVYSSLAYQGTSGLDLKWIEAVNLHALKPDLALLIDVDPKVVLQRIRRKRSIMENMETQESVRNIYLNFVEKGDLERIAGDQPRKAVSSEVLEKVLTFLNSDL
jgi:dTMP kinase